MLLKTLIEQAEKATGSQKELALKIGQSAGKLRQAKAGICGLPNYACVMIADIIGEERITVIAASELITEKKEERRKVWHPFVAHAASIAIIVTSLVTPSPAKADTYTQVIDNQCILCKMYS